MITDNIRSNQDAEKMAELISNAINWGMRNEAFCKAMSVEHRTLQQGFTRLCVEWLKVCASDSYRFDARNESSHILAKKMIEAVEDELYLPFI